MAPHKLVSLTTIIALSTLLTLLIKLIQILLEGKCIQGKIISYWPPCYESEAILSKKFCPDSRVHMRRQASIQGKIISCWPPCYESEAILSKKFRPGSRVHMRRQASPVRNRDLDNRDKNFPI